MTNLYYPQGESNSRLMDENRKRFTGGLEPFQHRHTLGSQPCDPQPKRHFAVAAARHPHRSHLAPRREAASPV